MRRSALLLATAALFAALAAPAAATPECGTHVQCVLATAELVVDAAQEKADQVQPAVAQPDSWVVDCAVGTARAVVRAIEGTPQPHAC
jgi:hypothetical protein